MLNLSQEVIPNDRYVITSPIKNDPGVMSGLAYDIENGTQVFVKAKDEDYAAYASLAREAELLSSLSHPQIPSLLDADLDAEVPYIVTEAMPGHPKVSAWLERRSMPGLAARLCLSALEPLDYLHQNGVMHRDINPSNLVMHVSGMASLVDFELGIRQGQPEFQPEGRVWGTVSYVAPERTHGKTGSPRADVYSMGATMYQLFYGKLPFTGETAPEIAVQQNNGGLDLTDREGRGIPAGISSIIERAMERFQDNRYGNAGEMRAELIDFLQVQALRES